MAQSVAIIQYIGELCCEVVASVAFDRSQTSGVTWITTNTANFDSISTAKFLKRYYHTL